MARRGAALRWLTAGVCGLVSITLLLVALPERSASEDIRPVLSGVLPVATPVHTEFDGIEALPVLQDTPPGQTGDDTGAIAGTEPAAGEVGDVDAGGAGPGVSGAGGSGDAAGVFTATACLPFPSYLCGEVLAIGECESHNGADIRAYELDAENGGRWQINKTTWERFFFENYGWSWSEIVMNDQRNLDAAFIVWQRAGGSFSPWSCAR